MMITSNSEGIELRTTLKGFSYCGWIPCLAGHLDFTLMSVGLAGSHFSTPKSSKLDKFLESIYQYCTQEDKDRDKEPDPKKYTFNFSWDGRELSNSKRRIALQSWVNWKDRLRGDGKFRVIVVAETNQVDNPDLRCLEGRIVIYPRAYSKLLSNPTPEDIARRDANASVMDILGEMYKIDDIDPIGFRVKNVTIKLNKLWEKLYDTVSKDCPLGQSPILKEVFSIKFKIASNGLTFLEYLPSSNNPYDSIKPEQEKYTICRQAFFYLKYSLHKHAYHNEEADSLTTTIKIDHNNLEDAGIQLICQLKLELIKQKREDSGWTSGFTPKASKPRFSPHTDCLGIIGYAKSLITSCLTMNLISQTVKNREMEYFESMTIAFKAYQERTAHKDTSIERNRQFSRQWTAIILAVLSITMFAIKNFFSPPYAIISAATATEISSISTSMAIATALVIFAVVYTFNNLLFFLNESYTRGKLAHMIKVGYWRVQSPMLIMLLIVIGILIWKHWPL